MEVAINGIQGFKCLGDSGASHSCISRLMAEKAGVEINEYDSPRLAQLAVATSQTAVVGEAICTIVLATGVSGSVTVRNTPLLILNEDMDEVLLGDDLLNRLGIDVRQQLASCYSLYDYNLGRIVEDEWNSGDSSFPTMGGNDPDLILETLKQKVEEAAKHGLKSSEQKQWIDLLRQHLNEFRVEMGNDPPANTPPLKVRWDPERTEAFGPGKVGYSQLHKEFLDYYTDLLEKNGLIRVNPRARFVSPAIVVPKCARPTDITKDFRLVVNLKRANEATKQMYWPMPLIEDIQQYLHGAKYYLTMDLKCGYWQIKLHRDSQELFSFSTHRKVFTPERVPQGATDAVMFFQFLMMQIFSEKLYKGLIIWLDDLLLYATTLSELFDLFAYVLEKAKAAGLKFSAQKTVLVTQSVKWCGKIVTPVGISVDPMRLEVLNQMQLPRNAGELMQFTCAVNWFRTSLPQYAKIVAPLQEWLKHVLENGKRTKKRAKGIQLVWDDDKKAAFNAVRDLIGNACVQAHPNPEATFCLFTDASDQFWGAVLGQVNDYDVERSIVEQDIEPLYFLSGSFRGSQLGWATVEKEGYAIVESVDRLRHLLIRQRGFRIFTDHRNLQYMFFQNTATKLPSRARLARWALRLQSYQYTVEHIAGDENVWADILSRWGSPPEAAATVTINRVSKRRTVARPVISPLTTLSWPSLVQIEDVQKTVTAPTGPNFQEKDGIWYYQNRIWIPEASELRYALIVIAHYGSSGHGGITNTLNRLKTFCYWSKMDDDVKNVVRDCVLCRNAKSVACTTIHHGERKRPTRPNEDVHFDYYHVGKSVDGESHLLVIRDGFSRLVELVPTVTANKLTVAKELLKWIARHGLPIRFFSDNGSHFRNEVMKELSKRLTIQHDYSTVYCAWSNGLIERVNRDITVLFKVMLHEQRLDMTEWVSLVPNVQYALNQRASESLSGHAPVTVHSGIPTSGPLNIVLTDRIGDMQDIDWTVEMNGYLEQLSKDLDEMHNDVHKATEKRAARARKVAEEIPEFEIGDYVLYSLADREKRRGKLYGQWVGPLQVVDIKSKYVYISKDLVSGRLLDTHATRMSFYSTEKMNVTQELKDYVGRQGLDYVVEDILDLKWDQRLKQYTVRVRWNGFSDAEASFEPFEGFFRQVPLLVLEYLETFSGDNPHDFNRFWKSNHKMIMQVIRRKNISTDRYSFISKKR